MEWLGLANGVVVGVLFVFCVAWTCFFLKGSVYIRTFFGILFIRFSYVMTFYR